MTLHESQEQVSGWENLDTEQIEFDLTLYDLFSGIQDILRTKTDHLTAYLGRPGLAGPLNTILYELASNGLKAIYRKAFYRYVIEETGLNYVSDEQWMSIFNSEIETNKALNFVRVCQEHSLAVRVQAYLKDDCIRFEVTNDGSANKTEKDKLNALIRKAKTMESLADLMADPQFSDSETDGYGIPLIIVTLKSLNIPVQNFHIIIRHDETVARIDFPLSVFRGSQSDDIRILSDSGIIRDSVQEIFSSLNYSVIFFSEKGLMESVSSSILDQLEIPPDKAGILPGLLKQRFFEDIFTGPLSIHTVSHFENYRIIMHTISSGKGLLYNVSGIYKPSEKKVVTLWQLVNVAETGVKEMSEGSIFENIHLTKLVTPYISDLILDKAIQSIRRGQNSLPNEIKDLTIMFLDLISFTHQSENMDPMDVINLLNTVMGITVHCIESNSGKIDKFLGDGIMSIFSEPLSAVIAAIEIQNNLFQLNAFRSAMGEPCIDARIGINSGPVILGSVGTKRRMDWTALGDVVNTASRIEKQSRKHSVLVSYDTYNRISNQVHIQGEVIVKVKGKDKDLHLVFIDSVTFQKSGQTYTLTLDTEAPQI